eukprot:m.278003 g.278003  ORF g.278003 m.278003 type:complete len:81 (+) comp11101_c0_seq77:1889-2131(+)
MLWLQRSSWKKKPAQTRSRQMAAPVIDLSSDADASSSDEEVQYLGENVRDAVAVHQPEPPPAVLSPVKQQKTTWHTRRAL